METRLQAARKARGWSQLRLLTELERLAAFRGLAVPSRSSLKTELSRWENGHVTPKEPYVGLLAEIYDLAPTDLGLPTAAPQAFLPVQRGAGVQGPSRLSVESVGLMDVLLDGYAKTDNVLGPWHLLHVATQHMVHLEPMLIRVSGPLRKDSLRLASRFAEFAGWLSQDAGDLAAAQHWTDRALDFLEESADPGQRAYVLMRKSAVAAERREHGRSLSLAAAACRDPESLTPRVRALALRQSAISHALVRDERQSERSAEGALEAVAADDDSDSHGYCTPAYVAMESGVSAFHLRKLDVAAERLSAAAACWPTGFARDQGLCLARLAVVEAGRGNIDVACAVGHDALAVAQVADSSRTRAALVSLNHPLAPYDRSSFVSEFRRELIQFG
jgi:transcriptional regulator with XRE-family HTH domain